MSVEEINTTSNKNLWNHVLNNKSHKLQGGRSSVEVYCGINLYETEVEKYNNNKKKKKKSQIGMPGAASLRQSQRF